MRILRLTRSAFFLACLVAMAGCGGGGLVPLMPTPAVYTETGLDPLEHIPEGERWVPQRVYYATTRQRKSQLREIAYNNKRSHEVSVGLALIGFGPPETTWADLHTASSESGRQGEPPLTIAGIVEVGRYPIDANAQSAATPDNAGWLLADINDTVDDARDKDILVYVHGAKVDFYNACAYAAQLDHFMGRDMTAVAFSWPTRQDIVSYGLGWDVNRAYDSAPALATLLESLASETEARRIHLLSWSAGGRVAAAALAELRNRHAELGRDELVEKLRLGTAYFAAADVPVDEFLLRLPAIHDLADQVIVTTSDNDGALINAQRFMGGGGRIGLADSQSLGEDQIEWIKTLERLEVVNVSLGSDRRGFDITGHRYWFDHPWASSDVLLSIRTDLSPAERGLEPTAPRLWAIPDDYPDRLRALVAELEKRPLRELRSGR